MGDFKIVKLLNPIAMTIAGTFTPKGAYNNATDYSVGDQVDYQGSSYIMYVDAVAGTLPTDTTKWGLVAAKGDQGIQGIQGDPGTTDHLALTNIGTNTHAQIDTHLANTSNPHSVTKTQVGLGNVDNTSDANKPVSTAQQTALNAKQDTISLTTTGTSGAATLISNTLNIPNYASSGGGTAASTTFTPAGNIAATDVQAAIVELDTEKVAKAGDTMTGALLSQTVRPTANSTYGLGTASFYYSALYAGVLNLNSTASISGATAGTAALTGILSVTGSIIPDATNGINSASTASLVRLSGGVVNDGALLLLGGSTHSSIANTGIARVGSTDIIRWTTTGVMMGAVVGMPNATHTLTMPNTATGIALYNTADQTTNYERFRTYTSGNVLTIAAEKGGTGAFGTVRLGSNFPTTIHLQVTSDSTNGFVQVRGDTASGGASIFKSTGTQSASSGLQYSHNIAPTINQTSTAGYTALLINPTETSTGSGSKLLADFQVGGVSKANIDNLGYLTTPRLLVNSTAYIDGASAGVLAVAGKMNIATSSANPLRIERTSAFNAAVELVNTHRSWYFGNSAGGNFGIGTNADLNTSTTEFTILPTTGYVGLGTTVPTHTLTLPSTSTGAAFYNTSDQTTNYERVRQYWNSSVYTIQTENLGTGSIRAVSVSSGTGSSFVLDTAAAGNVFTAAKLRLVASSTGSNYAGSYLSTLTSNTNLQYGLYLQSSLSQTSTAGYVAFAVNAVETTTGSGSKLLADFQVGGVSKAKISNTGTVTATAFVGDGSGLTGVAGGSGVSESLAIAYAIAL